MKRLDWFMNAASLRRESVLLFAAGLAFIGAILAVATVVLFLNLPDTDEFNDRVEDIFEKYDDLNTDSEIKLLEILAQSGTTFSEVLVSYRQVILILLVFSTALLVASLGFLIVVFGLSRRVGEIERYGPFVQSLKIGYEDHKVHLNNVEIDLSPQQFETLARLAEARIDGEVISARNLAECVSNGDPENFDGSTGATLILRLRDALGKEVADKLLIKTLRGKGYGLAVNRHVIQLN